MLIVNSSDFQLFFCVNLSVKIRELYYLQQFPFM